MTINDNKGAMTIQVNQHVFVLKHTCLTRVENLWIALFCNGRKKYIICPYWAPHKKRNKPCHCVDQQIIVFWELQKVIDSWVLWGVTVVNDSWAMCRADGYLVCNVFKSTYSGNKLLHWLILYMKILKYL